MIFIVVFDGAMQIEYLPYIECLPYIESNDEDDDDNKKKSNNNYYNSNCNHLTKSELSLLQ